MTFFLDNWMLVALALTSGGLLFMPLMQGMAARGISSAQAVQLMNREKAVVVDVSDPQEFAAGHIAGSKNIFYASGGKKLPIKEEKKNY